MGNGSRGRVSLKCKALSEAGRRVIREALLEIANQRPDEALCHEAATERALTLDRREDDEARHLSRCNLGDGCQEGDQGSDRAPQEHRRGRRHVRTFPEPFACVLS